MRTTVNDVKGAFIAMCAKMAGMPVGRTSFQDFEIAFLLNAAYDKCLKTRLDALQHANATYGTDHRPHRDHNFGRILSELGHLYAPATTDKEFENQEVGLADSARWKMWGINSRIFEIPPVNGNFPYVIGADLYEVMPKKAELDALLHGGYSKVRVDSKSKGWMESVRMENDLQSRNLSWPVRILSGSEVIEYAHLLQSGANYINDLPFRIGRIRTYQVHSPTRLLSTLKDQVKDAVMSALEAIMGGATDESDAALKTTRATWSFEQLYVIDLLHPRHMVNIPSEIYLMVERVMHPQPITEAEVKNESRRELECAFGYEIAEAAAALAMEALASGTKLPNPNQQPQK